MDYILLCFFFSLCGKQLKGTGKLLQNYTSGSALYVSTLKLNSTMRLPANKILEKKVLLFCMQLLDLQIIIPTHAYSFNPENTKAL
jgi:hypothetical protein